MPNGDSVTLYNKRGEPTPFARDMVNAAIAKGWSYNKPAAQPVAKAPAKQAKPGFFETHGKTREAIIGGFGGLGIPESTSPMTDLAKGVGGLFAPPKGPMETGMAGLSPAAGLPVYRILQGMIGAGKGFGEDIYKGAQAKDYPRAIHGVAGLTTLAGATLLGGKKAPELSESISKIREGSFADVLGELEKYRKTVSETPSKGQRIAAEKTHAAITERISLEWDKLYSKLSNKATDALGVKGALSKLAEVEPMVTDWIEKNIVESKSGASVTAPLWPKVRELSKDLNAMMGDDRVSFQEKARIQEAHSGLEEQLKKSADEDGLKQQYTRAYQLSRKLNNIKHHTAFEHIPVKPSRLFGLGGATAGIASIGAEGVGGYFLGRQAGVAAGEAMVPKGGYRIPKLSREGEKALWKELGEKPPKGTMKRVQRGRITHYEQPASQ